MTVKTSTQKNLQKKDIINFFRGWEKKKSELVGIEVEKFGVNKKTGETASYTGSKGFLAILGKMYEELGWNITKQKNHFIIQMKRGGAVLDLESDGRIELAGSPHGSIHSLAREFRIHQNEISEISEIFGIKWLGIGCQPLTREEEIISMPGKRKKFLDKYREDIKLQTGNKYNVLWSKNNSGINVNLDFTSEQDFARKSKLLNRLAPVFRAIFANSPFANGKFTKYMSYRYLIAIKGLPQCQIDSKFYYSDFSYTDWIDFIYTLPLIYIERNNELLKTNITFGDFMKNGLDQYQPQKRDFDNHMKTAWTEVRMRNVIEGRSYDSLPPELVPSVPALIKGLTYSQDALNTCEKIVRSWRYTDYQNLQMDAAKYGLQATIYGEKLLNIAKDLLNIAEESLKKERVLDGQGRDESHYLKPIKNFVFVKGKSPAEWIVERWEGEWNNNFFPLFEWCKY